jgi:hypothetical protein
MAARQGWRTFAKWLTGGVGLGLGATVGGVVVQRYVPLPNIGRSDTAQSEGVTKSHKKEKVSGSRGG